MLAAQDVRRADFRDDVGGDHAHHAVEAFLGADRGGHDLHQAAQQATGRAQLGTQPLHGGRRNRSTPAGGRDGHAALSAGAVSLRIVASERERGLLDQLRQDLGDRLHLAHQPDALTGHQRAAFDVAVDHGAAQRPRPEVLDRQRRLVVGQLAAAMARDHVDLGGGEVPGRLIDERPYRDDLELGVDLHGRHGVAGARADERLLEARVGDRFAGAHEARAHLAAGGAHAQIGGDRLAMADAAGDEHRHLAQVRQDLLGEHAGRHRADVAAGLHAFDDQRIGARAHQAPGDGEARGEAQAAWRRRP